jgi:hypothetical protein
MFTPVYLAALAALIFYILLPVVGAFIARGQWRQFRRTIVEAASLPELDPAVFKIPGDVVGRYQLEGEIDAISGQHELWIAGKSISCVIDLRDAWVFVLAIRSGESRIERRKWSGLPSIGPGARAFVAGEARLVGGRLVMGGAGSAAPLVLIHDGDDEGIVTRAIWAGRHENEYWNPITQVSLALGVASMAAIVSLVLSGRTPSLIAALTLSLAFSPALSLLPPGVIGFLAYRRFWKQARYYRAKRDIESLDADRAASARSWRIKADTATVASAASFVGALVVNALIVITLLRNLL